MKTTCTTDFGPDKWLKFPNQFNQPAQRCYLWKNFGRYVSIPVGSSAFGMCGGLASTALDIFYNYIPLPTQTDPPSSQKGKALFDWLRQRQVDSITLRDFCKYLRLMFASTKTKEDEISEAWEQIKEDIQLNRPVLIGLQRAKIEKWYKIHQIADIIKNHQVVVWKFEQEGEDVTLYVYDSKTPDLQDVTICFNLNSKSQIKCNPSILGPIYAFFKTSYKPKKPPTEISEFEFSPEFS